MSAPAAESASPQLQPDGIVWPAAFIAKRAIIAVTDVAYYRGNHRKGSDYIAPDGTASIVTIEGGGDWYVNLPSRVILAWLRSPGPVVGREIEIR